MIPRAMLACTKPVRADKRRRSRSVETRAGVSRPSIIITKEVLYESYPSYNSEYLARCHTPGTACRAYIVFSRIIIKEVTKPSALAGFAAITYIQKNRVTITVNQKSHIARPNWQTERAFSIKHAFLSPPIQGTLAFLTQKKK